MLFVQTSLALLVWVGSVGAHPANYVKNKCTVPDNQAVIMGKPVLNSTVETVECTATTGDDYTCSVKLEKESEILLFVDGAGSSLDGSKLECGESTSSGHDHGHRQLGGGGEADECGGKTVCEKRAVYSTKKSNKFHGLILTSKSESTQLVLLTATGYGQATRTSFDLSKITKKSGAWHSSVSTLFAAVTVIVVMFLL
jgi:hypothetical protein